MLKQYSLIGLTLVVLITALYVSCLLVSYPRLTLSAVAIPAPIELKKITWDIEPNNNPFIDRQPIIKQNPLASLTLAQLHLLGVIKVQDKALALIQTPDKKIYRLGVGAKINSALGFIIAINANAVYLKVKNQALPQALSFNRADAS